MTLGISHSVDVPKRSFAVPPAIGLDKPRSGRKESRPVCNPAGFVERLAITRDCVLVGWEKMGGTAERDCMAINVGNPGRTAMRSFNHVQPLDDVGHTTWQYKSYHTIS